MALGGSTSNQRKLWRLLCDLSYPSGRSHVLGMDGSWEHHMEMVTDEVLNYRELKR
jgi:hypothetical protein